MSNLLEDKINSLIESTKQIDNPEYTLKNKEADAEGCSSAIPLRIIDGDTVELQDTNTGNVSKVRLKGSEDNYFDTVETSHTDDPSDVLKSIITNPYKIQQYRATANLYKKDVKDLTKEEFDNVGVYSNNAIVDKLQGRQIQPFDPNKAYTPIELPKDINIRYKIIGTDKYNRPLVDIYNTSNKSIVDELANNPSINLGGSSSYGIALDTLQAVPRVEEPSVYGLLSSSDTQAEARFYDWILPDSAKKWLKNYSHNKQEYSILDAINPEIADAMVGVSKDSRISREINNKGALKKFIDGDYLSATLEMIQDIPATVAESLPQSALFAGGAIIGTPAFAVAVALYAGDMLVQTREDYKKNNNGKEMPLIDQFKAYSIYVPAALLEGIFTKGLGKSFVGGLGKIAPQFIKEGITELPQEMIESGTQTYFSQDQSKLKSPLDIYLSKENLYAGVKGFVTGGGQSLAASTVGYVGKGALDNIVDVINKDSLGNLGTNKSIAFNVGTIDSSNIPFKEFEKSYNEQTHDTIEDLNRDFNGLLSQLKNNKNDKETKILKKGFLSTINKLTEQDIDYTKQLLKDNNITDNEIATMIADAYRSDPTSNLEEAKTKTLNILTKIDASEITKKYANDLFKVQEQVRTSDTGYITNAAKLQDALERDNTEDISKWNSELDILIDNQYNKAEAIIKGLEELQKGKDKVDIEWVSGRSGKKSKANFNKKNIKEGTGYTSVINSVLEDISSIKQISDELSSKYGDRYSKNDKVNRAIQIVNETKSLIKNIGGNIDSTVPTKKVVKYTKEDINTVKELYSNTKNNKPNTDILSNTNNDKLNRMINVLDRMISDTTNNKFKDDLTVIRNDINNRLDASKIDSKPSKEETGTMSQDSKNKTLESKSRESVKAKSKRKKEAKKLARKKAIEDRKASKIDSKQQKPKSDTDIQESKKDVTEAIVEPKKDTTETTKSNVISNETKQFIVDILKGTDTNTSTIIVTAKNQIRKLIKAIFNSQPNIFDKIKLSELEKLVNAYEKIKNINEDYKIDYYTNYYVKLYKNLLVIQKIFDTIKEINELKKDDITNNNKLLELYNRINKLNNSLNNSIANELITNNITKVDNILQPSNKVDNLLGVVKVSDKESIVKNGKEVKTVYSKAKDILNKILDINKSKIKIQSDMETPAYKLLFNRKGEMDPNVVLSIRNTIINFLANRTNYFDVTKEEAEQRFKEALGYDDIENAYSIAVYQGSFFRGLANLLGRDILTMLGLEENINGDNYQAYNRMVASIGSIAVMYGTEIGLLEVHKVKKGQYNLPNDTNFVRLINNDNTDNIRKIVIEEANKIKNEYDLSLNKTMIPSNIPFTEKESFGMRKFNLAESNIELTKSLNIQRKIPYKIDSRAIEFIKNNKIAIAKLLGRKDKKEIRNMFYDERLSITGTPTIKSSYGWGITSGKNGSIERSIDNLLEAYELYGDSELFFDWFYGRNGRMYTDSNTINPQTDKLHRLVILNTNTTSNININNKEEMFSFYEALAVAFDNYKNKEHIEKFAKAILKVNVEDLTKAFLDGKIKEFRFSNEFTLGIAEDVTTEEFTANQESVAFVMQAIFAIQDYQEAVKNNSNTFTTNIVSECDAVTSGYGIRNANAGSTSIVEEIGNKTGMFLLDENTNNTIDTTVPERKAAGKLDIYQSAAKDSEIDSSNLFGGKKIPTDKTITVDIFDKIKKVLPKINEDGSISSKLRNMAKPAVTVFGYGAGKNKIQSGIVNYIIDNLLTNYNKIYYKYNLNNDEQYIVDLFNTLESLINEDIIIALKYRSINNIFIDTKMLSKEEIELYKLKGKNKVSLQTILATIIKNTYTENMYNSLDNTFKEFSDDGSVINTYTDIMGKFYSDVFKKVLKEISKNRVLTVKQYKEFVKKFYSLVPAINTALSNSNDANNTKLPIIGLENAPFADISSFVTQLHINSNNNTSGLSKSIAANISTQTFTSSGAAAAVYALHATDSSIMAYAINKVNDKYGTSFLSVHDAIVSSPKLLPEITKLYNEGFWELNKKYSMIGAFVESTNSIIDLVGKDPKEAKTTLERILIESINDTSNTYKVINPNIEYLKRINMIPMDFKGDVKLNILQAVEYITKYYNNVTIPNRDKLFNSNKPYAINVLNTQPSSSYLVNAENIPNTKNNIDATIEDQILIEEQISNEVSDYKSDSIDKELLTEEGTKALNDRALSNIEEAKAVLNRIIELSKENISDNIINMLNSVLDMLNLQSLKDTNVYFNRLNDIRQNIGEYSVKDNTITIDSLIYENGLKRSLKVLEKSSAEIYVHEIVHAVLHAAITAAVQFNCTSQVKQLRNLMLKAKNNITYEDLIPSNVEITQEVVDRAKEAYNYIFDIRKVKDISNYNDKAIADLSLSEFIAHALTNPTLREKLSEIKTKEDNNRSFIDNITELARNIFNLFAGKGKFSDLFPTIDSIINGTAILNKNDTLLKSIEKLTATISSANNEATDKLRDRFIMFTRLAGIMSNYLSKSNAVVSRFTKDMFNIASKFNVQVDTISNDASRMQKIWWLSKNISLLLVSKAHREALPKILYYMGFEYHNDLQTIIRNFSNPSNYNNNIIKLSGIVKKVENSALNITSTIKSRIENDFGGKDKLSDSDKNILTNVVLNTDLCSLLDEDLSIDSIKDIVSDNTKINNKINEYLSNIKKYITNDNDMNLIIGLSNLLADYMITGIGNEALELNATSIVNTVNKKYIDNKNLIDNIDKLVTMYSLLNIPLNERNKLSKLNNKGLNTFIKLANTFKDQTNNELKLDPLHSIKGYTKSIFNPNYKTIVAPMSSREMLENEGYTFIGYKKNIIEDKSIADKELGLFKSSYIPTESRTSSTFMLHTEHNMGTTIKDIVYAEKGLLRKSDIIQNTRNKANKNRNKLISMMKRNGKLDNNTINSISNGLIPIINLDGNIIEYRISMSNKNKIDLLEMNTDGIDILSRMFSSIVYKTNTDIVNKGIIDKLYELMEIDKNKIELYKDNKLNSEYVLLDINSKDKYIKEVFKILPKNTIEYIKSKNKPLYVKRESVLLLFGVKDASLANVLPNSNYTRKAKYGIRIAEQILSTIAYLAKQNIILKIPEVLLGNIVSNLNVSISRGRNISLVIKKSFRALQNTKQYLSTSKKILDIETKASIGTATEQELNSLNILRDELVSNPVHDLMEAGMFQSVVEDVSVGEEVVSRIGRRIESKIKVSKGIKTFLRNLYVTEGTPVFNLMFTMTQYSDFISRQVEYEFEMENAPKLNSTNYTKYKDNVINDIKELFINYDIPDSTIIRYANKMGFLMFTKFFVGVQKIIFNTVSKYPVSSLLFMTGQSTFLDSEDIFEQLFIFKDFNSMVYNPIENFINVAIPVPVQAVTGM